MLYVLLHCPFVWNVWSSLLKWWGLQWVISDSVAGLLSWWEGGKLKKQERKIRRIVPIVALWSIWKLRNDCAFKEAKADIWDLSDLIKTKVAIWLISSSKAWQFTVSDFIYNLNRI